MSVWLQLEQEVLHQHLAVLVAQQAEAAEHQRLLPGSLVDGRRVVAHIRGIDLLAQPAGPFGAAQAEGGIGGAGADPRSRGAGDGVGVACGLDEGLLHRVLAQGAGAEDAAADVADGGQVARHHLVEGLLAAGRAVAGEGRGAAVEALGGGSVLPKVRDQAGQGQGIGDHDAAPQGLGHDRIGHHNQEGACDAPACAAPAPGRRTPA